MMLTREYRSPAAFKQALEQRLRTNSLSGVDFARRRQLVVFDRFLARVSHEFGDSVTLKGGLAIEFRLHRARTTKDVDLRVVGSTNILSRLQAAARHDLGDFMEFRVRPDDRHPDIQNEGMKYDGLRFRAECLIAGKAYGRPFGVDVAFADPIQGEPLTVIADNALGFAGIAPPTIRIYPIQTHIAEKLHAYTMPRRVPNSRVKDLPDLALLAGAEAMDAESLRGAITQTFAFRSTHAVPERLASPPTSWAEPYLNMAKEDGLPWSTLPAVFEAAAGFLDPVLKGAHVQEWQPQRWCWRAVSDDAAEE